MSYEKKDDHKCNHFKKMSDKAMHNNQSSLSSADTLSGKRSCSHSRSPSCSCSCFCSRLSSRDRSYTNHHVSHDDHNSIRSLNCKYSYSEDNNDGHYHCPDKNNIVFAAFAAPKANKNKRTPK
jgi:hypothetical protein